MAYETTTPGTMRLDGDRLPADGYELTEAELALVVGGDEPPPIAAGDRNGLHLT